MLTFNSKTLVTDYDYFTSRKHYMHSSLLKIREHIGTFISTSEFFKDFTVDQFLAYCRSRPPFQFSVIEKGDIVKPEFRVNIPQELNQLLLLL